MNWSVRFLIAGGHRSEGTEIPFAKTAVEITEGKWTTAPQMAKSLKDVIPQDDPFRNAFAIAQISKSVLARYLLRAIEDQVANAPNPEWIAQPEAEKVNLEHILPVNPATAWNVSEEEAKGLHTRIGNLAIMQKTVNGDIRNYVFADKKPAFQDSSYVYTAWVAKQLEWTEKEITARQMLLANEAVKTWPLRVW